MRTPPPIVTPLLAVVLALVPAITPAQSAPNETRIATASNFSVAMKALAARFKESSGHTVVLSFGSSGKHYAQITNGAPFDAFFAADVQRPERLEKNGLAVPGTRFTYAIGKIFLWSHKPGYIDVEADVLKRGEFHRIAIANPKLAPYGRAAQEALRGLGLWEALSPRLVRGENINQAYQFVHSENAELGFVARSQIVLPGFEIEGSFWEVPQELYRPIEQQAVLLTENETARAFLSYVQSEEAQQIIRDFGYDTPGAE